jgi:thymidylate synthase
MDQQREPTLNLHLTQRSCDIALGLPYNIAGYAFLLELFSRFSGIRPGKFAHTLIDAHIYTAKPDGSMAEYDHAPGLREQLTRAPRPLPKLRIDPALQKLDDVMDLLRADTDTLMKHFQLDGYEPHPAIKFKVAV